MTIDTIEELRAELRDCVFTSTERMALELELAELIRERDEALKPRREHNIANNAAP